MESSQLPALWHTTEHVLTQATLRLYPSVLPVMGPPTEEGFYFDFDASPPGKKPVKVSTEDFPRIETEMQAIINQDLPIRREIMTFKQAEKLFKSNPYKLEWLAEIKKKKEHPSVFWTGDEFADLCAGPHVKSTGEIKAFKLLAVAGAYWKGDAENKQLQRIYGISFRSQKELDLYLTQLEEAKKRDHRKIGKELDLFVFSDLVGKGLPLFTERGATIRRELERFIVDEEVKRGYQHVYTPDIARVELYEKSGHYPYYKDSMYPLMQVDEERLILRPMTCPHHFQLYTSRPRSYRELPVRIAELAKQYRYEKSGELTGLMRVRLFCLADAHIVCQKSQAEGEINNVLDLIDYVAKTLGLKIGKDYRYRLSKGDRHDEKKFYKDDIAWNFAEEILRKVLKNRKAPFFEAEGEAAYYGPKIDIQMKNVSGKEDTAFTVQYDFVMPKRFELCYIDQDGEKKEPVVIHRSSIGALERVIAFLIERYAGAFPVWLAPVQVQIIPISGRHSAYAAKIAKKLKDSQIRVEIDDRAATMQARIRDAQLMKVPYMLIVGDQEEKNKTVTLRLRSGKNLANQKLGEAKQLIIESLETKQ